LRHVTAISLILLLSGCASTRHFAADTLWPFGNPNAPPATSETAQRALGQSPDVTPIAPQAGDVWPGAVKPMPTLSEILICRWGRIIRRRCHPPTRLGRRRRIADRPLCR